MPSLPPTRWIEGAGPVGALKGRDAKAQQDKAQAHARRQRQRRTAISLQAGGKDDRQNRQDAGVDQGQKPREVSKDQLHSVSQHPLAVGVKGMESESKGDVMHDIPSCRIGHANVPDLAAPADRPAVQRGRLPF